MITREQARHELKRKGWSYRRAAPELGVCFVHLAYVLTGKRESRRLLDRIHALHECPDRRRCA